MTPAAGGGAAAPDGAERGVTHPTDPAEAPAEARGPARLVLGDPMPGTAAEDRPESWGERGESDEDRLGRYLAARPPHHGG